MAHSWSTSETRYFLQQCLKRNELMADRLIFFNELALDMRKVGHDRTAKECESKLLEQYLEYVHLGPVIFFGNEMELILRNYKNHLGKQQSKRMSSSIDVKTKRKRMDSDFSNPSDLLPTSKKKQTFRRRSKYGSRVQKKKYKKKF